MSRNFKINKSKKKRSKYIKKSRFTKKRFNRKMRKMRKTRKVGGGGVFGVPLPNGLHNVDVNAEQACIDSATDGGHPGVRDVYILDEKVVKEKKKILCAGQLHEGTSIWALGDNTNSALIDEGIPGIVVKYIAASKDTPFKASEIIISYLKKKKIDREKNLKIKFDNVINRPTKNKWGESMLDVLLKKNNDSPLVKLAINVGAVLKLCTFDREKRTVTGCNINLEYEDDDEEEQHLTVTLIKNDTSDKDKAAEVYVRNV